MIKVRPKLGSANERSKIIRLVFEIKNSDRLGSCKHLARLGSAHELTAHIIEQQIKQALLIMHSLKRRQKGY